MDSLVRIKSAHPLISSPLGGEDKGEGDVMGVHTHPSPLPWSCLRVAPPCGAKAGERVGVRAEKKCLFRHRNFGIYNTIRWRVEGGE